VPVVFNRCLSRLVGVAAVIIAAPTLSAQLRVATWNISNYSGGRDADLKLAIYGLHQGRSMAPDVILTQEFTSQAAVNSFLNILNTAPGSPGDWQAAAFSNGADTDNAFFYRTSKVTFLGQTITAVGSSSTANQPRDTNRYDIRIVGYSDPAASIGMYSTHMKAQGGTNSGGRRLIEAQRIRANAQGVDTNGPGSALPAGFRFLVGGDFNIQTSNEAAYQAMVALQDNDDGRLFDPINTPGSWNNSAAFALVHTQDPIGAGGMDDRHDQILLSATLIDGQGLNYIGNPSIPYRSLVVPPFGTPIDNTQWNDPNHSYRSWGNDGTSFDGTLVTVQTSSNGASVNRENGMVGAAIGTALRNTAAGGGHLPVFLDLRVPAKLGAPPMVDFGTVEQFALATMPIHIGNAGDVDLWTVNGIDDLRYDTTFSGDIAFPVGSFIDAPGGGTNLHILELDTSVPGPVLGTIIITSNDVDEPLRHIMVTGTIVTPGPDCPGDINGDNAVNGADLSVLLSTFGQSVTPGTSGDLNGDGVVNGADLSVLLSTFGATC